MSRDPVIESAQHRHIASNLPAKISEMSYFLEMMKDAGKRNFALFEASRKRGSPWSVEEEVLEKRSRREVLFASSAFCNTVQTLEDTVSNLRKVKNLEVEISRCRHNNFVTKIRNATTHDGTPTADLWSDGKIYFVTTRTRYGQGKNPIQITPPTTDLISCCVEFSHDYCHELLALLTPLQGLAEIMGNTFSVEMYDEILTRTDIISSSVMASLKAGRAAVAINAALVPYDPIPKAIEELQGVILLNKNFSY